MSETLRALLLKIEHELTTECGLVVTDKPGEYDDALQSGCDASGARDCQAAVSWKIDHAELLDEIAAALRSLPGAVTGGVTDADVERASEIFDGYLGVSNGNPLRNNAPEPSDDPVPKTLSDALAEFESAVRWRDKKGNLQATDAEVAAARTAIVALFADVEGERNGWKAIAESNRDAYTEIVEAGRKGFMSKEWCLAMSEVEGTSEVGAGREVGSRKKLSAKEAASGPPKCPKCETPAKCADGGRGEVCICVTDDCPLYLSSVARPHHQRREKP